MALPGTVSSSYVTGARVASPTTTSSSYVSSARAPSSTASSARVSPPTSASYVAGKKKPPVRKKTVKPISASERIADRTGPYAHITTPGTTKPSHVFGSKENVAARLRSSSRAITKKSANPISATTRLEAMAATPLVRGITPMYSAQGPGSEGLPAPGLRRLSGAGARKAREDRGVSTPSLAAPSLPSLASAADLSDYQRELIAADPSTLSDLELKRRKVALALQAKPAAAPTTAPTTAPTAPSTIGPQETIIKLGGGVGPRGAGAAPTAIGGAEWRKKQRETTFTPGISGTRKSTIAPTVR